MSTKTNKEQVIETAQLVESSEKAIVKKEIKKVKLDSFHSKQYLDKKRESLEEEVIFILPNGKEY